MTEQQETSVGFVLTWMTCAAMLFALAAFVPSTLKASRNAAHDWAVAQEESK